MSRYLRFFSLSSPYLDQTLRSQRYAIAGGQFSNDTAIYHRDALNGNLTEIVSVSGFDSPTSYIWL